MHDTKDDDLVKVEVTSGNDLMIMNESNLGDKVDDEIEGDMTGKIKVINFVRNNQVKSIGMSCIRVKEIT